MEPPKLRLRQVAGRPGRVDAKADQAPDGFVCLAEGNARAHELLGEVRRRKQGVLRRLAHAADVEAAGGERRGKDAGGRAGVGHASEDRLLHRLEVAIVRKRKGL